MPIESHSNTKFQKIEFVREANKKTEISRVVHESDKKNENNVIE
jgi:hypothetical protein